MSIADIPQLQHLTVEEKVQLIDELWCSLPPEYRDTDEELIAVLEERIARYDANPASGISLKEFKRRWEARES